MKVVYIDLLGRKYPMCFSLNAISAISERFGSIENMGEALDTADAAAKLRAVIDVAEILLKAGRAYVALTQDAELPPEIPGSIGDAIDMETAAELMQAIQETMSQGTKREVEATSKNADPTRAEV